MTAISFPVPNRIALLFDWFRRTWRDWFYRALLDACEWRDGGRSNNVTDQLSTAKLFASGHAAAAVWTSRVRLEKKLSDLCEGQTDSAVIGKTRPVVTMVPFLLNCGALSKRQARRINNVDRTCSKVVHYGKVEKANARQIVSDVEDILQTLDYQIVDHLIENLPVASKPEIRIVGFAQPEYEAAMIAEQFGDVAIAGGAV